MVEIEPNQEKFIHKLFLDTYRSLYAYALAVLRDPQRAEELVQDVFLLAIEKTDVVMRSPNPKGWLFRAVKNQLQHEYRARQRMLKLCCSLEALPEQSHPAAPDAYSLELQALRAQFTPEEWDMLQRAYIRQERIADIAAAHGISYDACRKRLYKLKVRARRLLACEMEKGEEGTDDGGASQ